MEKATKPDKTRQLSIEQQNAIDHLLQGKSDRVTAEAVGVSRQTVWEWGIMIPFHCRAEQTALRVVV